MYTVAQPVKIKKIYHNGNHLEDKGNFCLSGSGDGTDVDISGYCEYIIEQHDDERGDSVLHQCFVVGVKSDNPIITKQCDQIDLPRTATSGLVQALRILRDIPGIGKVEFGKKDIVRHQLVQRIVEAYQAFDEEQKKQAPQGNEDADAEAPA